MFFLVFDLKILFVFSIIISIIFVKFIFKFFIKLIILMMKFYIIELSSIMFNVKLSLVIFVIFKSINFNIVDVKYFLYIINGCFIFE